MKGYLGRKSMSVYQAAKAEDSAVGTKPLRQQAASLQTYAILPARLNAFRLELSQLQGPEELPRLPHRGLRRLNKKMQIFT